MADQTDERGTDSRELVTLEWAAAPTTPVFDRDRAETEALNAELGDRAATSQVLENTARWFTRQEAEDERLMTRNGILLDAVEAQRIARGQRAEQWEAALNPHRQLAAEWEASR